MSQETRNIAAVRTLFESYREAWRTHKMPPLPKGLVVWAPGATAEVGGHDIPVEPHDAADAPYFLDIEAQFYWAAIPDWRVTQIDVCGTGDQVISLARFEGTTRDGAVLEPTWLADRWTFDDAGLITHWRQIADLATWGRWSALNTETDYVSHVSRGFAALGLPPRFVP